MIVTRGFIVFRQQRKCGSVFTGVKPYRPAKDAREFALRANSAKSKPPSGFEKAKAEGFRPRKG
jgi:hypothetical protein